MIDTDRLTLQLKMLPDIIKRFNIVNGSRIKVTTVRTVCEAMNHTPSSKELFSELHHLLHLFLTVPVTTATSERSLCCLRRVKTYLRTTMTQERLNHLLLLYCHKTRTDSIDILKIVDAFISVNERRALHFGTTQ